MMEKIVNSEQSLRLMERFKELYDTNQLLDESGFKLRENPDIRTLYEELLQAIGSDLKKHLGIDGPAGVQGDFLRILENTPNGQRAKCSVTLYAVREGCMVHYGAYDTCSGTCIYLGSEEVCLLV